MRTLDDIASDVIDASMAIHRDLGSGLLESVYQVTVARSLEKRGLIVEQQLAVQFEYDGMVFEEGFRVDLLSQTKLLPRIVDGPGK